MLKFTVESPYNRLPEIRKKLDGADAVVNRAGERMVQIARSLVRVRTGQLRDSIRARKTKAMNIVIEATAPHAAPNEYGTRYMSAQPFMRPAMEIVKPDFIAEMKALYDG